jgi:hypothetical protein
MQMTRTKAVLFSSVLPLIGALDARRWSWRLPFIVMSVVFGTAAWLTYGNDIDTQGGLRRVTTVQLALLIFMIVGFFLLAWAVAKF